MPSVLLSAVPLLTLVSLIVLILIYTPDSALSGASQFALIVSSSYLSS